MADFTTQTLSGQFRSVTWRGCNRPSLGSRHRSNGDLPAKLKTNRMAQAAVPRSRDPARIVRWGQAGTGAGSHFGRPCRRADVLRYSASLSHIHHRHRAVPSAGGLAVARGYFPFAYACGIWSWSAVYLCCADSRGCRCVRALRLVNAVQTAIPRWGVAGARCETGRGRAQASMSQTLCAGVNLTAGRASVALTKDPFFAS